MATREERALQSKTIKGSLAVLRVGEPEDFRNMRKVVRAVFNERYKKVKEMVALWATPSRSLLEKILSDAHPGNLSQQMMYLDLYDKGAFDDVMYATLVRRAYAGLFTLEEFLGIMKNMTKKTTEYTTYAKECQRAMAFFAYERNTFDVVFRAHFRGREKVDYEAFIHTCLNCDIYPIRCVPFKKYYIMFYDETHDDVLVKAKGIATRLVHVTDEIATFKEHGIDLKLPVMNGEYLKRLENGVDPAKVLKLPTRNQCSCGRMFVTATALAVHKRRCKA